jgi:hypothetical protein
MRIHNLIEIREVRQSRLCGCFFIKVGCARAVTLALKVVSLARNRVMDGR